MAKYFVQIINIKEAKGSRHVRFPAKSKRRAEAFNASLIKLFRKHSIDSCMGSYRADESCPYGHTS